MRDHLLSRAFCVRQPKAAAAFGDPLRRRIVLLLVGPERSLSDLARMTGLELKRLHYHVTALVKLGLVAIASTRSRAGRPIQFYRAVADSFYVPAELMTRLPHAAMEAELREALADSFDEGVLYHRGDNGELVMQPVAGPRTKRLPTADFWRVLELSPVEAQRLVSNVEACLNASVERCRGAAHAYLVRIALAPRAGLTMRTKRS